MDGWPVWLASLSVTDDRGLIPTDRWGPARREWGDELLTMLLGDLGDTTRERSFRMCATLCRHRALAAAEVEHLPREWHEAPAEHLAGGSLEILWETVPGAPSTRPCVDPTRIPVGDGRLYLPGDCGECEPCRARAAIEGPR
jgi:hypothetical protein